jgi:hypothetical protein
MKLRGGEFSTGIESSAVAILSLRDFHEVSRAAGPK